MIAPRTMTPRALAAGLVLACGIAACSSASTSTLAPSGTPSPSGSQATELRFADAPALLVQCMLDRGTLKPSDSALAGQSSWLHGTDIVLTPTSASQFTAWFAGYDGTVVAGQNLTGWAQWAAVHDQLPAAVCGSSVSASALQMKVFAADPAAGDPWGS